MAKVVGPEAKTGKVAELAAQLQKALEEAKPQPPPPPPPDPME